LAKKTTWLCLPDLHFPYHDQLYLKIVEIVISITSKELDGILQLGDFVDFFQISKYSKDPSRKNTIKDDLTMFGLWLAKIDKMVKHGTKFWITEGNHEARLTKFIWDKAPELYGLMPTIPEILNFQGRSAAGRMIYKWFPMSDWDACQIGDCIFHHGHYFNQHVAMGNLTKYPTKIVCGHTHRFQYVSNGEKFSVSLGHGAKEDLIAFTPTPSQAQQAFAIITVVDEICHIEPVLVKDGFCVFRGEPLYAR
jgi:UDP-2,3-diacylglucosamine pyrophosphatase LpxH